MANRKISFLVDTPGAVEARIKSALPRPEDVSYKIVDFEFDQLQKGIDRRIKDLLDLFSKVTLDSDQFGVEEIRLKMQLAHPVQYRSCRWQRAAFQALRESS